MKKGQKIGGVILAGLAALGLYKFLKLSKEDKAKLTDDIKHKGKELLDQIKPMLQKEKKGTNNVVESSQS